MEMLRATSGRSMSLSMLGDIAVQDAPTIVTDWRQNSSALEVIIRVFRVGLCETNSHWACSSLHACAE